MASRAELAARFLRAATPTAIGLAGVVLLALPIRLIEGHAPTPLVPLIVVFFWSIYGPAYLPPASVFAIGLMQDLVNAGPLGLWPAAYLAIQYLASSQRAYFAGREAKVVWIGFGVSAFVVSLIMWLVMSLLSRNLLPLSGLLVQMAMTFAVYPVFAFLFGVLHRRVIVE